MHRNPLPNSPAARWTRRDLLKTGTITTCGALIGCATPELPHYPSIGGREPEIDVHCHVFNIRDMPFYEMLVYVILDEKVPLPIARPLGRLIVSTALTKAPKAEVELAELKQMAALGQTKGQDDPERDPVALFQAGVDAFLRDHVERRAFSAAEEKAVSENEEFLIKLYRQFGTEDVDAALRSRSFMAGGRGEFFRERALAVGREMKAQSDGARAHSGPAMRAAPNDPIELAANFIMNWAPLYSKYRYRLASQLLNFVGEPRPLRFVAPAILDVEHWMPPDDYYDPGRPTPTAVQAELMKYLSLVQPSGVALHGFIGFDPVRYALDEKAGRDGLAIIDNALQTQGLVGVKLYPPMGFKPLGNAGRPDSDFPESLSKLGSPGRRVDDALLKLYAFCIEKQVPIMAHSGESNGPTKAAAKCAYPGLWEQVLNRPKMSELRLNLAHAGGLWGFDDPKGRNPWVRAVEDMLANTRYPNLYADVGDVANFLDGTHDRKTRTLIANMRGLRPAAKAKLMYGTDWTFLGRYPGASKYRASFEAVMAKVLETQDLSRFFYLNAAAFMGLAPGAETRRRLDAFYISNQRQPPNFLDAFSQPPPMPAA